MGFITFSALRTGLETDVATLAERAFDYQSEAGCRFIEFLKSIVERKDIALNAPTVDAWDSEVRLVRLLADRGADRGELNEAVGDYCNTHWLYRQTGPEWKNDVPLYWMRLLLNGETVENTTCNEIQAHLIRAYWESCTPEGTVVWNRI